MGYLGSPNKPKTPFVADRATTELAAALAQNGNSLTAKQKGAVYRSGDLVAWDMRREWHGRELTSFTVRESLWSRAKRVTFYYPVQNGTERSAGFFIEMDLLTTDEETTMLAEAYMMALNLRRTE